MVCTFFGHRNTPQKAEPSLKTTLIDLIENKNVCVFYVGNHGEFDSMVLRNLKQLKAKYPHISYYTVLAYMPTEKRESDTVDYSHTVYPEELEDVMPRFAILKRNKWMIEKSDYVVTYVEHAGGGASQFKELAEKKNKTVINLSP